MLCHCRWLPPGVQALKPVGVAAVAVLALYSREPPSKLLPGEMVTLGDSGLASCAFLPAPLRNGCEPLRAGISESGALVVFKGGKKVPSLKGNSDVEDEGEVVWSSPVPWWHRFEVRGVLGVYMVGFVRYGLAVILCR